MTPVAPTDRVLLSTPTVKTFKRDLERAGIEFADGQGGTVDRYGTRTTFISWLGLHRVHPRAEVILARHAPEGVAFRDYQDFATVDLLGRDCQARRAQGPPDGKFRVGERYG